MSEATGGRGARLDWNDALMHPKTAGGFVLVVRGVAPVPTTAELRPLPIGIAGIICSYIGRNQARERGLPTSMATAGLICAIVGTVLSVLLAILIGTLIITTSS